MDWILRGPQIHSTFSNLGHLHVDGYHVNENCYSALQQILRNLQTEDKFLRNYRRNISFGQNIEKDLLPLLTNVDDDKIMNLLIRILGNLTTPVDCLVDIEVVGRTDLGRHTIFEINNLLTSTKVAFSEPPVTKVIIEFLKENVNVESEKKLSEDQLNNVNNCLLLLRNILHIPEHNGIFHSTCNGSNHFVQNQILWNIFSQSIDKVIIKAMNIRNSNFFGVTMVQLVGLLYKNQHIVTLHKHLSNWHETCLSESSVENESNTSSTNRGSEDSSAMLTSSDGISDSSDSQDLSSKTDSATSGNISWENGPSDDCVTPDDSYQPFQTCDQDVMDDEKCTSSQKTYQDNSVCDDKSVEAINENHIKMEITDSVNSKDSEEQDNRKQVISKTSDYGYGTQIENQESVSTSSNDDDLPPRKPFNRKRQIAKQRPNNEPRTTLQEQKKRKIAKRVKANVINIQGLDHSTPTDDEITKIIQEFTVDFLLKGYNSLVKTLHTEILTNRELIIDHFFWLVKSFLKFATQMELDLEIIDSVLCIEIFSYLAAEGVNLCEQFKLALKFGDINLKPNIRRQHMLVSTVREFVQAIDVYEKIPLLNEDDHETLQKMQIKMFKTQDLSSLCVLLLRHYDPKYHSKEYLKDLVVTNHILLMFLENMMQIPEYNGSTKMIDHLRQFSTPAIVTRYGQLLEDFKINGDLVNDCIFTTLYQVGGNESNFETLFQPNILKSFSDILKSEFEIYDDWTDLIKGVLHSFIKKRCTNGDTTCTIPLLSSVPSFLKLNERDYNLILESAHLETSDSEITEQESNTGLQNADSPPQERWTENEISILSWNYLQCSASPNVISAVTKHLREDNINKSRTSVIRELFRQNLISKDFHESQLKGESDKNTTTVTLKRESRDEQIRKLGVQLLLDGKSSGLEWVQQILLEVCYAKLLKQRKELDIKTPMDLETKFKNFECFRNKDADTSIVSPVVYHSLIKQESVPLVTWNCEQANICKDLKFLQLLYKLGFHMPVDTNKMFIRVPHAWTAEFIYTVAGKIRPIDTSTLKFSVCDLSINPNLVKDGSFVESSDNLYQMHKPNFATMVNFTPTRPVSTYTSANAIEQLNWLQIVKKSQQSKLTLNLKSISVTTEDVIMKSALRDSMSALKSQVTATSTFPSVLLPPTSVLQPPTSILQLSSANVSWPPSSAIVTSIPLVLPTVPTPVIQSPLSIMMPTTSKMLLPTSAEMPATSVKLHSTSVMEPTTSQPTMSIKEETSPYDVQREWETASVALDLSARTSAYKWNGEQKPGVIVCPGIGVAGGSDQTPGDAATASPRPHKTTKSKQKRRKVLTKRANLRTTDGSDDSV